MIQSSDDSMIQFWWRFRQLKRYTWPTEFLRNAPQNRIALSRPSWKKANEESKFTPGGIFFDVTRPGAGYSDLQRWFGNPSWRPSPFGCRSRHAGRSRNPLLP